MLGKNAGNPSSRRRVNAIAEGRTLGAFLPLFLRRNRVIRLFVTYQPPESSQSTARNDACREAFRGQQRTSARKNQNPCESLPVLSRVPRAPPWFNHPSICGCMGIPERPLHLDGNLPQVIKCIDLNRNPPTAATVQSTPQVRVPWISAPGRDGASRACSFRRP